VITSNCIYAMGDIIEIIFALVAGAFWLFGSSFFKSREEEPQDYTPPKRRSRPAPVNREQDARQREIREAIRRKIEERRQKSEPASTPAPRYTEQPEPTVVYSEPEQPFYVETANAYEQEMQQRLEAIEATKRKAEALKKKAAQATHVSSRTDSSRASSRESAIFTGSVRSSLRNPQAARAAFIYGEVLGKPMSLQKSAQLFD